MIQYKLIALGVTLIATIGYAIYNHYQNRETPHQYSYGPRSQNTESNEDNYIPGVEPLPSQSGITAPRRRKRNHCSDCSICLQDVENNTIDIRYELKCGHAFHRKCISVWLEAQGTCPNCRAKV